MSTFGIYCGKLSQFVDLTITGTSMKKRTEFNRMIAACKRGRIDMILTKSLSRFARNTVDCLNTVRMLKAKGIGVIFEKENLNTLTEYSEFLITLFSGFAQAESESLSKNVKWGKQKSAEAGNVTFQYKKLLGYRRGADGKPEIVPDEAETVRRIFRRYLDGASLGDIKKELEADGIPTSEGVKAWSYQVIQNILTNEKYIGDALLLKTYVTDPISKKIVKNLGDQPMYYVENNHPAIVPKEIFNRAKEEMARWAIVAALNEYGAIRREVRESALELAGMVQNYGAGGSDLLALRRRLDELTAEQTLLLDKVLEDMDNPGLNAQLKVLVERIAVVDAETIRMKLKDLTWKSNKNCADCKRES